MFVPYRQFAATESWFTAGPLIHRALDRESHDSLDARIIDAERDGEQLVFGWLRYSDSGVEVVATPAPGTTSDFRAWLEPLVDTWASTEAVSVVGFRSGGGWNPGT